MYIACLVWLNIVSVIMYNKTALIRTLVARIANYPDRLGLSGKRFLHFLTVIVGAG